MHDDKGCQYSRTEEMLGRRCFCFFFRRRRVGFFYLIVAVAVLLGRFFSFLNDYLFSCRPRWFPVSGGVFWLAVRRRRCARRTCLLGLLRVCLLVACLDKTMSFQGISSGEALVTRWTRERLGSHVDSFVSLQVVVPAEALCAEVASERPVLLRGLARDGVLRDRELMVIPGVGRGWRTHTPWALDWRHGEVPRSRKAGARTRPLSRSRARAVLVGRPGWCAILRRGRDETSNGRELLGEA